jgi:hypothetical protein
MKKTLLLNSLLKDLKRIYDFSRKQLMVTSSDTNAHWTVA